MKVWIVWLPNVWKSTLFNALTKTYAAEAANFPFCTIEPNVGIVNVNDARLEALQKTVNGQRIVPATVEFVDIAGIVEWASRGEWLWNKFLANIREASAILQVVRAFDDANVHHVSGSVNPQRDMEIINAELILADIESLQRRMGDNEKKVRAHEKEALARQPIYERLMTHLNEGKLAITLDLTAEERLLIADLYLLSNKPFIYAVNVAEDKVGMKEDELRALVGISDKQIPVLPVCAKLESDMMELSSEERTEFLKEYGIEHSPMDDVIKTCYDLLGLQYYFTAGEIEVHAWTIKKWWTAPEAAGVIHTDFQKKFIKAETANWKDLVDLGGWAGARSAGKVRMEWKEYIVQDGDVMVFKFGG